MRIGIAVEADAEFFHHCEIANDLDRRLKASFAAANYGDGVQNIFVGVLLIGPGGEKFHPTRPFKFTRRRKDYGLDSHGADLVNIVEFDVKPAFLDGVEPPAIAEAVLEGFDQWKSKLIALPSFDAERFLSDVRSVLLSGA